MKYLLDNNISHRYAAMLRALDVDIEALRERFPQDIHDVDLYAALSSQKVAMITGDRKQQTRVAEARQIRKAKVICLWLEPFWGKMHDWSQAAWLITHRPQIDEFARNVVQGTCATIKRNGKCQMIQL